MGLELILAVIYRLHLALLVDEHWKEAVAEALCSEMPRAMQDSLQGLVELGYSCYQQPKRRLAMWETSLLTASLDFDS